MRIPVEVRDTAAAQSGRRYIAVESLGIGKAEALVVHKEVGLAAKNFLGNERSAKSESEATEVITGKTARRRVAVYAGNLGIVVILPGIRRPVVVFVVLISGAVERIGSALGHDLDFRVGRTVEVGSLIRGVDLELLDAVGRSRHHAHGTVVWRMFRGAGAS